MTKRHSLDRFYNYFDILPARSPASIKQAQHLRHQVYCIETGFQPPNFGGASALECDEFDPRSVHSLIRHRSSGLMVATVRLVLTCSAKADVLLPMEHYCGGRLGLSRLGLGRLPRACLGEVSRFAVSKSLRQHLAQGITAHSAGKVHLHLIRQGHKGAQEELKLLRQIHIGLVAAVVRMSVECDITHLCAAMEPSLMRLLSRFGIHFKPLGGSVDYHGTRFPCLITVDEVLEGMRRKWTDLWEFVVDYAYHTQSLKRRRLGY